MEKHGSESYFVLGEGLLTESVGGRERSLAAAVETQAPPFRFSRMGPIGIQRQLGEPNRRKIGNAMAAGGGGASPIPAGFTYLGQFVDHDLTFDKTKVMLGQNVTPAQLLQARSPSLDLDSLYGAGPTDPGSTRFYAADGIHLKMGNTRAAEGIAAKQGFDLPRGAGTTAAAKRKAIIPDPRNDENLAVAQDAPRLDPFSQPSRRQPPGLSAARPALRSSARDRHQALPVDAPHRLPAPHLHAWRRDRRLHQREKGVRGRGDPDRRSHDADRVLRGRLPTRALYDPDGLQLEQDLRRRLRHPRTALHVLGGQRKPRRGTPASKHLDRGLPPAVRLQGSRPGRPRRARGEVQPGHAHRHDTRTPAEDTPWLPRRRGQPRLPQPDQSEDGEAGHRTADGHIPEEQGRHADQAHEGTDPRRQQGRPSSTRSPSRSKSRSSTTHRFGSTSCGRPNSAAAS